MLLPFLHLSTEDMFAGSWGKVNWLARWHPSGLGPLPGISIPLTFRFHPTPGTSYPRQHQPAGPQAVHLLRRVAPPWGRESAGRSAMQHQAKLRALAAPGCRARLLHLSIMSAAFLLHRSSSLPCCLLWSSCNRLCQCRLCSLQAHTLLHLPHSHVLLSSRQVIAEFVNPKYADASKTAFKSSTRLECMMQVGRVAGGGGEGAGGPSSN